MFIPYYCIVVQIRQGTQIAFVQQHGILQFPAPLLAGQEEHATFQKTTFFHYQMTTVIE